MNTELRHSGPGISSFVLSIIMAIMAFTLIVIAGVMETNTPGGIDENSANAVILGLFIILCLLINVVAFFLGLAALFQNDRKKLFAVLGMIFSGIVIFIIILLIIIGLNM